MFSIIQCVIPEHIHTHHMEGHMIVNLEGALGGWGGMFQNWEKFLKKKVQVKPEFPANRGSLNPKSCGEGGDMDIFWNNTIAHFQVGLSLIVKARLSAKFLLWKLVFIHMQTKLKIMWKTLHLASLL